VLAIVTYLATAHPDIQRATDTPTKTKRAKSSTPQYQMVALGFDVSSPVEERAAFARRKVCRGDVPVAGRKGDPAAASALSVMTKQEVRPDRDERNDVPVGHRNGYERPQRIAMTPGPMEIERPRVRDASKLGFESRIVGKGVARTYALETLVICSFLRGLSVRDVEASLEEAFDQPVISKSTVSRVLEDTRERYRRWCERRLEEHDLVYLFLDAICLKLHPDDTAAEGALVAWGVTLEGRKVLLGLQLGRRESYANWLALGRDLIARGMDAPGLVCADGAPGLSKAVRELWPRADEQRCLAHALKNVTAKLPERHHTEIKTRWRKTFDEAVSPAEARRGLEAIIADYRAAYPYAMGVIERELDQLVIHLHWPSEQRKRIRTTSMLERTFVEVRRRTKVLGRFPGETSALSLIWAVLELSSRGWRGMVMSPKTVAEIQRIRREQKTTPSDYTEEVIAA
jgi:putative transposase